jgi:putative transposase
LQEAQQRVDLAFKAFFRRVKAGDKKAGYPRFKSKWRYDSFTYTQSGFALDSSSRTVLLCKIRTVKIKFHRATEGMIKRLNVNRRSTGKWLTCFTLECEPAPRAYKGGAVAGIDVGITSFATLSNGEHIKRFFRAEEKALGKAKRTLAAQEKGAPQRVKKRKVVARVHERIANRRNDFARQLSRQFVTIYGLIAFELLNVKRHNAKQLPRQVDRRRGLAAVYPVHGEQNGRSWLGRGDGRPYKYYANVLTVRSAC